jgi:hypothetical protein
MARCPKCKEAQDWWKLLRFDKTQLMICQRCGSCLSMDSQRATILIGGLVAILFLPETNLLPFDWGFIWFIVVLAIYTPFYIYYMKLNIVSDGDLDITPNQEADFVSYTIGRSRLNYTGHILLWGGLLLFLAGMSVSSMHVSELVSVLGLLAVITGLGMLAITRCPFCKKITVRNPFDNSGRCINCHRDIDVAN